MKDEEPTFEILERALVSAGLTKNQAAIQTGRVLDEMRNELEWKAIPVGELMREKIYPPRPTIGTIQDSKPLFYQKAVNSLFGTDNAGKTFLMQMIAIQEMKLQHHVVWIDFEEMDAQALLARMAMVGVDPELVSKYMTVFVPNSPIMPTNVDQVVQLVHDRRASLVVIDSFGEMLARSEMDENRDADVASMFMKKLRPIALAGAAVVVIDHVTKSGENGDWPAGSKRKRAAINGSAYSMTALNNGFMQDVGGASQITCVKSRHGHHQRGSIVGFLEVSPGHYTIEDDGELIVDVPLKLYLVSESIYADVEETADLARPAPPAIDIDDEIYSILSEARQPCRTKYIQSMLATQNVSLSQKAIEARMRSMADAGLLVLDRPGGYTTAVLYASR